MEQTPPLTDNLKEFNNKIQKLFSPNEQLFLVNDTQTFRTVH